jgi:DNA-binding CsgD family transcriptional regulator
LEIIRALAAGQTNRDIAIRFGISEETVKHHLTNMFNKVGVAHRLELALFALSHNLIEVEPQKTEKTIPSKTIPRLREATFGRVNPKDVQRKS